VQWDGTSGAAPIVAGIAALVRAAHPDLDADNVINRIIRRRARRRATQVPDEKYGYGLIDARRGTADVATVDSNPMGDLADWIRLYRAPTSAGAAHPDTPAPRRAAGGRDRAGDARPCCRARTPSSTARCRSWGTLAAILVRSASLLLPGASDRSAHLAPSR
jgi:subtilisin family serine protease